MADTTSRLSGVIPPMVTPLTEDRRVDVAGLEKLTQHLLDGGVSGIFVLGSSGEGPWFTEEQQALIIRTVVQHVDGRVPVLAGALEPSAARTNKMVEQHAECGADIVVIASPYYFGADADAQIYHIKTLATESPVPLMLYNIPPTTHNPLVAETVREVIQIENIIGIKDSAGDMDNFRKLVEYREARPEFVIFQGAEKLSAESVAMGADGIVPGMGNLIPTHFVKLYEAAKVDDTEKIAALQQDIDKLWTLHTHDYWLVCLKYAASVLGYGSGQTAGHISHLDDASQQAIAALLKKVIDEAPVFK